MELRKSGYGLHIDDMFMSAILYVDVIALLACSYLGLYNFINICVKYSLQCDIKFNSQKTQLAYFG